ncbi:hypothetical protein ECFRIK1997_3145, partial [Escherichia coli FRIK1997]
MRSSSPPGQFTDQH